MVILNRVKKGFTLMELLIVIAVIGILISIATASYSSAQKKARDSRRKGDLKAMQNALEQYYSANSGQYPAGTYPNTGALTAEYLPNGAPLDPKLLINYIPVTWTATAYRICADLEGDGTYNGSNQDSCVSNLQ